MEEKAAFSDDDDITTLDQFADMYGFPLFFPAPKVCFSDYVYFTVFDLFYDFF